MTRATYAKPLADFARSIAPGGKLLSEEVGLLDQVADLFARRETTGLKPSAKGIALIHSFESCKLNAYPDPGSADGNPWTIGWGSTGPDIKKGTIWTQEQADARFERDLAKFAEGVTRLLGDAPTTQGEFDACVSLAYNIGLSAFANSTLLRKHKAGDRRGAADEFLRWTKNDGRVMRGLVRRREAERALYLGLGK